MTQQNTELSPRRRGPIRRILRGAFYLIVLLIGGFAIYAWATGARQEPIETGEPNMKAVVYTDYGSPDVLQIREIKKPVPNDDQILIKVHAASVNPLDWHFMEGTPYIMRAMGVGLRKPKTPRIGTDVAGEVEAVGKNVTQFKPGDEVFGGKNGAFSEYVCARANGAIVPKPPGVTFEQAASIPIAGITALQAIRDKGKIQPGQKVLINGASGGVGTFAVQIAKSFGAEVTGVCSTRNLDLVRSLGADRVIDYTKEDFTNGAERYDVIIDNVGTQPLSGFRRVLTPNGILVMIGGGGPNDGGLIGPMGRPIKALILSPFVSQKMGMMMADLNKQDLTTLGDLMQAGKVKAVIDRTYPLSQIAEAIRYLEAGHARGKVIITMGDENKT
jgi:NADPH:quinone reductase-like Zn-dependent oxidoreductase